MTRSNGSSRRGSPIEAESDALAAKAARDAAEAELAARLDALARSETTSAQHRRRATGP